jgi:hypothetical protein
MITLISILIFFVLYVWSIFTIKKKSDSWRDFNPYNSNLLAYSMFFLGTSVLVLVLMTFIIMSIINATQAGIIY